MRRTAVPVLAILLAASAPALSAQQAAPADLREAPAPNRLDVQVAGGVTTYYNAPHASAGGLVRLHLGAWSALAMGSVGAGSGYESLLVGLAAGRGLLRRGELAVTGLAGAAFYRDRGNTGIARRAPGVLVGAVADHPLGPFVVSAMLSDVFGRYRGDEYLEPFFFNVPRLTLAFGL